MWVDEEFVWNALLKRCPLLPTTSHIFNIIQQYSILFTYMPKKTERNPAGGICVGGSIPYKIKIWAQTGKVWDWNGLNGIGWDWYGMVWIPSMSFQRCQLMPTLSISIQYKKNKKYITFPYTPIISHLIHIFDSN